jgi:serine/threonine protein kinase
MGSNGKPELRVGGRYRLGRKIGSGSFGDIYLGSNINCFPASDHQVLTEHGWMYLHNVEAHFSQHETLKIACYEDQALEYHPIRAKDVSVGGGDYPQLHIGFKGETTNVSNHVDLLPTAGHNMFVKIGESSGTRPREMKQKDMDRAPLGKKTAMEVFQLGMNVKQTHLVQLVANFEKGLKVATTKLPFEDPLGLTTQGQVDAFLWLYGQ